METVPEEIQILNWLDKDFRSTFLEKKKQRKSWKKENDVSLIKNIVSKGVEIRREKPNRNTRAKNIISRNKGGLYGILIENVRDGFEGRSDSQVIIGIMRLQKTQIFFFSMKYSVTVKYTHL